MLRTVLPTMSSFVHSKNTKADVLFYNCVVKVAN